MVGGILSCFCFDYFWWQLPRRHIDIKLALSANLAVVYEDSHPCSTTAVLH